MKENRNLHLKVQEFCDCFATTDPLKEMSSLEKEEEKGEAALKWLALAVLHGINSHAKKISISKSADEKVAVTAEYREAVLPSPGFEIGGKIIDAIREITHLEGEKGKSPLTVGIRNESVDLHIKLKKSGNKESVTLKFAE